MFRSKFLKGKKNFKIDWREQFVSNKIANELYSYLPTNNDTPIVFVCIGTDRSTGDSLGPLVGSQLIEKKLPNNFHVMGTLEDPVHAVNLQEKLLEMEEEYTSPFVIGIDACLGHSQSVGSIQVIEGPLKPGAGVNKSLPQVGHIHMTGIVNISGYMEFFVLQNTRLYLVMNLAKQMANGIYKAGLLYSLEEKLIKKQYHLDQDALSSM